MPGFHHVEVWVATPPEQGADWAWLLGALGFRVRAQWPGGVSWEAGGAYLTLTTSPNLTGDRHDRRRPGLNHLALRGGTPAEVDAVMSEAPSRGWMPLYHERYPHAGGPDHYAGWLENAAGFKVEVVADRTDAAETGLVATQTSSGALGCQAVTDRCARTTACASRSPDPPLR